MNFNQKILQGVGLFLLGIMIVLAITLWIVLALSNKASTPVQPSSSYGRDGFLLYPDQWIPVYGYDFLNDTPTTFSGPANGYPSVVEWRPEDSGMSQPARNELVLRPLSVTTVTAANITDGTPPVTDYKGVRLISRDRFRPSDNKTLCWDFRVSVKDVKNPTWFAVWMTPQQFDRTDDAIWLKQKRDVDTLNRDEHGELWPRSGEMDVFESWWCEGDGRAKVALHALVHGGESLYSNDVGVHQNTTYLVKMRWDLIKGIRVYWYALQDAKLTNRPIVTFQKSPKEIQKTLGWKYLWERWIQRRGPMTPFDNSMNMIIDVISNSDGGCSQHHQEKGSTLLYPTTKTVEAANITIGNMVCWEEDIQSSL